MNRREFLCIYFQIRADEPQIVSVRLTLTIQALTIWK